MLAFLSLLIACQEKDESEAQQDLETLEKTVMQTHNEAMDLMGEMEQLRSDLRSKLDSSSQFTPTYRTQLKNAKEEIEKADEAMWQWMYSYNLDSIKSEEQQREYLVKMGNRMREVHEEMRSSIETAQQTLKNENAQ